LTVSSLGLSLLVGTSASTFLSSIGSDAASVSTCVGSVSVFAFGSSSDSASGSCSRSASFSDSAISSVPVVVSVSS